MRKPLSIMMLREWLSEKLIFQLGEEKAIKEKNFQVDGKSEAVQEELLCHALTTRVNRPMCPEHCEGCGKQWVEEQLGALELF